MVDVPNLLMHAMAAALSEKTFTWIPLSLRTDTRLRSMGFNSRVFKHSFFIRTIL